MPFSPPSLTLALSCALLVAVLASPVAAFGAGNIGQLNCATDEAEAERDHSFDCQN